MSDLVSYSHFIILTNSELILIKERKEYGLSLSIFL